MVVGAPLLTTAHASPEIGPMPPQPTCSTPDCANRRKARTWCRKHYMRWQRHGDTVSRRQSDAERFWLKVDRRGPDECWLWTASTRSGYGQFWDGHTMVPAHRWAYEHEVGPIPADLQIDHLCRTRACQNVRHMEPVTNKVNSLRGVGFSAVNARKTHCPRGHEYTPENTYREPSADWRVCRTCRAARQRHTPEAVAAAVLAVRGV